MVYNGQTDKEESLGVNANVSVGYRRLSKGEHALRWCQVHSMTMHLKWI